MAGHQSALKGLYPLSWPPTNDIAASRAFTFPDCSMSSRVSAIVPSDARLRGLGLPFQRSREAADRSQNGDTLDNTLDNYRLATYGDNAKNRSQARHNSSGCGGVTVLTAINAVSKSELVRSCRRASPECSSITSRNCSCVTPNLRSWSDMISMPSLLPISLVCGFGPRPLTMSPSGSGAGARMLDDSTRGGVGVASAHPSVADDRAARTGAGSQFLTECRPAAGLHR